jgi:hypothetical protein
MGMVIPQENFEGLHAEAQKHQTYDTFRDEMLRLAESVWHHAKAQGTTASEPVDEDQETPQDITPAAPVQTEWPATNPVQTEQPVINPGS